MELLILIMTALMFVCKSEKLYPSKQEHIILCTKHILQRDFKDTQPLVISIPEVCRESPMRSLGFPSSSSEEDNQILGDKLLKIASNFTTVLIKIFSMVDETEFNDDLRLHQGYIILLFTCNNNGIEEQNNFQDTEEDTELEYILENQMLFIMERITWNPRAKYLFIVTDTKGKSGDSLSLDLAKMLWKIAKIVNFIILIPNCVNCMEGVQTTTKNQENEIILDLFSWIPYANDTCDKVENNIKMDHWVRHNEGQFLRNASLYPISLPNDFHGCPLNVATFGVEPYAIVNENYNTSITVGDDQDKPVNGLNIDLIYTFAQKYNFTLTFLPHESAITPETMSKILEEWLLDRMHIFAGGTILFLASMVFGDPSHSIVYDYMRFLVPCPVPIGKLWRVLNTFTVSTWLALTVVLILSSIVTSMEEFRNKQQLRMFTKLPISLYRNWAVLLGISAPDVKISAIARQFFILYVWYCFVVNQLFQAYFVTFLVEPEYERKLETLEDLRLSKITFGFFSVLDNFLTTVDAVNFKTVASSTRECHDLHSCMEEVMFDRNLAILTTSFVSWYVARKRGVSNVNKVVCFLKEDFYQTFIPLYVRRGNPILSILNEHIDRTIESGLQQRYESGLKHQLILSAEDVYDEELMYSAFTMKQIGPVFWVLLVGYSGCIIVLVFELMISLLRKKIKFTSK
ncbi:Ionotropic receptor 632 [Blattella germanica]|nr:Ionotropic receptor 632 [Blattella germanica]